MLTTESGIGYSESLKTVISGFHTPSACIFYTYGRMRAGNILNTGQSNLITAFSESVHYSFLVDFLKKVIKMTNSLTTFNFNNNQVRTEFKDGEVWFCLKDVCTILELPNVGMVKKRLNAKGVNSIDTLTKGGNQKLIYINEPNIYRLALRSDKPAAEPFIDWVTGEVLPTIRKTGGYGQELQRNPEFMKALGGLVKNCCRVAVREELAATGDLSPEQMKALIANTSLMIELTAQARTKQLWQEKEQKIKQIIG